MRRFDSILVHCGLPKTGSTSLQHALMSHSDALEASGVLYPRVPGFDGNHSMPILHLLGISTYAPFGPVDAHLNGEAWTKTWADLQAGSLAANCRRLVISAECLWAMPAADGARFFAFLNTMLSESGVIEAVGFFRHPVDWMNSMRNEFAKVGFTLNHLRTFLDAHFEDALQPFEIAAALKAATPDVQWHVGRHEDLRASGGIVLDFWTRFALPGQPPPAVRSNESLCFEAMSVLTILASEPWSRGFNFQLFVGIEGSPARPSAEELELWWAELGDAVNEQLAAWGLPTYHPLKPTAEVSRWPRAFFEAMNRRLDEVEASPVVRGRFWRGVKQAASRTPRMSSAQLRLQWHVFTHRKWLEK